MMRFFGSLLALTCLVACGDDDGAPPDAGTPDAAIDGGDDCAAIHTQTVGPEGGTVEHCGGARMVVPAGALTAPTELTIERLATTPEPFSPYVKIGDAFAFRGAPAGGFTEYVDFFLPHDGSEGRIEMAELVEGEWLTLEACEVTETHVMQSFRAGGSFVALRDPTPYPDSVTGAGEGEIAYDFDGLEDTLSVDPDGYAIDEDPGEGRAITVVFRRSEEGALVQVDLRFSIDAEGVAHPVQLERADTSVSEIWGTNVIGFPKDLVVTLTRDEGGVLEGSIDAVLHLGDQARPFSATFSATPVTYRYPPERACVNLPKG